VDGALEFFRKAEADGTLNVDIWTALISAHADNGYLEMAFQFVTEMERAGIQGNITTWTTLVSAAEKHDNIHYAQNIFQKLQQNGKIEDIPWTAMLKAATKAMDLHFGKYCWILIFLIS